MPRNRPHIDRVTKEGQILDVAEEMLLRDGFERTTMAAIARAAGVASNSIYWYFPGKDDVFAAVLQRRLDRVLNRIDANPDLPMAVRAAASLRELDEGAKLTAAVHERARHSPAVAKVHQAFHDAVGVRLATGFATAGMAKDDAATAAAALVAMIEGIHLHEPERDPDARDRLVRWLIDRFSR